MAEQSEPEVQRLFNRDLVGLNTHGSPCESCDRHMSEHEWADLDRWGFVVDCCFRTPTPTSDALTAETSGGREKETPMAEQSENAELRASLSRGLEQSAAGRVHDLGSFAQYAEDDGPVAAALSGVSTHNGAAVTPENLRWAATHEALCRSYIFDVLTGLADALEAEATR